MNHILFKGNHIVHQGAISPRFLKGKLAPKSVLVEFVLKKELLNSTVTASRFMDLANSVHKITY